MKGIDPDDQNSYLKEAIILCTNLIYDQNGDPDDQNSYLTEAIILYTNLVDGHDRDPDDRSQRHKPTQGIRPTREIVGAITGWTVVYPCKEQNELEKRYNIISHLKLDNYKYSL